MGRFISIQRFIYLLLGLQLSVLNSLAQPAEKRISRSEYIDYYKDDAIKEMLMHGIPASITLAQGLLESADGNSPLAKYANNHFGIKCHSSWQGMTFYQDDDKKNECFRKYNTVYESFKDHSEFLAARSRYEFLFKLSSTDYKGWAYGLKAAGYATNPKYPDLLIKIVEENELHRYDLLKTIDQKQVNLNVKKTEKLRNSESHKRVKITDNRIKYVIAQRSDTYYKIAKEHDMGLWQIYKYNDLEKGNVLNEQEIVYLQPKRRRAAVEYHTVQEGETIKSISQKYGVKLKSIYKFNRLSKTDLLQTGQRLNLKRNR